jgi:hypothetical protein
LELYRSQAISNVTLLDRTTNMTRDEIAIDSVARLADPFLAIQLQKNTAVGKQGKSQAAGEAGMMAPTMNDRGGAKSESK